MITAIIVVLLLLFFWRQILAVATIVAAVSAPIVAALLTYSGSGSVLWASLAAIGAVYCVWALMLEASDRFGG